jgi:hypothetical protein
MAYVATDISLVMRATVAGKMMLGTSIRGANLMGQIGTWSSQILESVR